MSLRAGAVVARYLRDGWTALSAYDLTALGFDPFTDGPVAEQAFVERAARLVEGLGAHNLIHDRHDLSFIHQPLVHQALGE